MSWIGLALGFVGVGISLWVLATSKRVTDRMIADRNPDLAYRGALIGAMGIFALFGAAFVTCVSLTELLGARR